MNVYRPPYPPPARVFAGLVYVVVIAAAFFVADSRLKSAAAESVPAGADAEDSTPFFSLSTNRSFAASEKPVLWLDHRGITSLDFRVYRVNDPQRFFTQLNDPHQLGDDEEEEIATNLSQHHSLLERIRAVKVWAYARFRNYIRRQLKQDTRKTFNQKFRAAETVKRVPLNVADYARVPLLNPNQLVTTWREPLPIFENDYDRRMIPLGKQERGVYLVEAVSGDLRAYTVVVVTDLAMVEKASPNGELLVYTVDRKTGEPKADARIDVVKAKVTVASGKTNAEGLFRARITKPGNDEDADETSDENFVILASQRDNFAISDLESYFFGGDYGPSTVRDYIYTDRPVYRPNHTVFFKGIVRENDEKERYRLPQRNTVHVSIKDSNDGKVFEQDLRLSKYGTFNGQFALNDEAPLGCYRIIAETDAGEASGTFQVAEYKKPEYKVTVTTPKQFVPAGSKSKFDIDARYFFGAPVAAAEVKYYVYRSRYYVYFGDDDYDDSNQDSDDETDYSYYNNYDSDLALEGDGKLDASGHLTVDFDVPESNESDVWTFQYRLEAQVTDSSRRSIDANGTLIATRGSVVPRATPDRYLYNKDDNARVTIASTDYEGHPVPAKLSLQFMLRTWEKVAQKAHDYDPDYAMKEVKLNSAEVSTDNQGNATYDYRVTTTGSITIKVVVHDADKNYTFLGGAIWATGVEWPESCYYSENTGSIKLVPDMKSYKPGDIAHVLAILPEDGAHLLVTTELDTVMSSQYVRAAGRAVVLDVPIDKRYEPNFFLNVTFVKDGDMYSSDQQLAVPARDKLINLEVVSNKNEYKPRETASYTILARDADGAPVPDAEVSLGVVDEAIYSVSPDFSGNIRQQFYGHRYNSIETHLSVSYYFRGVAGKKPIDLAATKHAYQLADFKNEDQQVVPMIRKEFKDTAFWEPSAVTGRDGRATLKFRLPDNLTTWRATARAVTADLRVGMTKHKVIARKDVILRVETPRFLTQGDTVTFSGIVHNYLKEAKSTQISIAVAGAQLVGPAQQTLTIAKLGEHRIDWQVSAQQTGQVKLLAKALTDTESDAVELTLDVVPRGLHQNKTERWTTADDDAEQEFSLEIPANSDLNSRKLRIEVAPSVAGTLFGALDYLTSYPYGCTEQTMSSFLPNIIVAQTLKDFKSTSIHSTNDLQTKVEKGRNRLYAFQHEDGGWGWWKNDESDPFMTAYVVDGLTLAKQTGYEVDDERLARGRERLQDMLDSEKVQNPETRAFVVYALAESGGVDSAHLEKLFAQRSGLQPYGRALLALTLSRQHMDQRALEVATEIERSASVGTVSTHWESKREAMLDFPAENSTEGTALSLKALARIKPNSSLLPLAARWLVSERANGYYWNSTKDTAFAIFGLVDYVKVSHELNPSYDVEVYVNGQSSLSEHVSDANLDQTFLVNRGGSAVGATNHVRVVKRGKGTLYLSASVEYYTNEEYVSAYSSPELEVTREYRRLSVEPDGYKLKWAVSPLSGEIHSGDLIVVQLRLRGKAARHLMLEDPIPSGAEQLENVGNLNLNYTDSGWTDWYSSREFRDRRTVFFFNKFDGDVKVQYAIRVLVPGEFVVAPARVERMYEPWVFANTSSGEFRFLDRTN